MHNSFKKDNMASTKPQYDYITKNLRPQFELDDVESENYRAILKRQADDKPFTFIKRNDTEATILRVNHLRATAEEAIKFKEFMLINIHQGHRDFIIDLLNCEFMDSTFLGAIIMVTKKIRNDNGSLLLVADPQKLKLLHAFVELKKILSVHSTIDEAVNEYNI